VFFENALRGARVLVGVGNRGQGRVLPLICPGTDGGNWGESPDAGRPWRFEGKRWTRVLRSGNAQGELRLDCARSVHFSECVLINRKTVFLARCL